MATATAHVLAPLTANLSASPSSIQRGQPSILKWSTTDATKVTLSNVGDVDLNGETTVWPKTSTNYTLKATNAEGASQTADVTVFVKGTPAPPAAPGPIAVPTDARVQEQADIMSDVVAVKGTLSSIAAEARAEYEKLTEPARGAFHQALNDLENRYNADLAAMHTLFGAAREKKAKPHAQ
jgi:hypothetical protein